MQNKNISRQQITHYDEAVKNHHYDYTFWDRVMKCFLDSEYPIDVVYNKGGTLTKYGIPKKTESSVVIDNIELPIVGKASNFTIKDSEKDLRCNDIIGDVTIFDTYRDQIKDLSIKNWFIYTSDDHMSILWIEVQ